MTILLVLACVAFAYACVWLLTDPRSPIATALGR